MKGSQKIENKSWSESKTFIPFAEEEGIFNFPEGICMLISMRRSQGKVK